MSAGKGQRGSQRLEALRRAIELLQGPPETLCRMQQNGAHTLRQTPAARGFHAYVLPSDDYEIARCHDAPSHESRQTPPRPRRLRDGDVTRIDAGDAQHDVIFSRTDAEWL